MKLTEPRAEDERPSGAVPRAGEAAPASLPGRAQGPCKLWPGEGEGVGPTSESAGLGSPPSWAALSEPFPCLWKGWARSFRAAPGHSQLMLGTPVLSLWVLGEDQGPHLTCEVWDTVPQAKGCEVAQAEVCTGAPTTDHHELGQVMSHLCPHFYPL